MTQARLGSFSHLASGTSPSNSSKNKILTGLFERAELVKPAHESKGAKLIIKYFLSPKQEQQVGMDQRIIYSPVCPILFFFSSAALRHFCKQCMAILGTHHTSY